MRYSKRLLLTNVQVRQDVESLISCTFEDEIMQHVLTLATTLLQLNDLPLFSTTTTKPPNLEKLERVKNYAIII